MADVQRYRPWIETTRGSRPYLKKWDGGEAVLYSDYATLELRVKALEAALKMALPVLDEELQGLCNSFCPPCEVGEVYDYSELQEPQLGYITRTEAALDAVDAALATEKGMKP